MLAEHIITVVICISTQEVHSTLNNVYFMKESHKFDSYIHKQNVVHLRTLDDYNCKQ